MIVGVVGLNGSGKNTFAEYIVKKYGFIHKDLGEEIRSELKKLGKDYLDRNEMIKLGNDRRIEFGFDYWVTKAMHGIDKDLVITSIRNPKEVQKIVFSGGVIIEVSTNQKIRYERTIKRVKNNNSHGKVKSFNEFKDIEEKELKNINPAKQQLLKCLRMAKFHITNNSTKDVMYKKIDKLFKRLMK